MTTTSDQAPDLHALASGFLRECTKRWPTLFNLQDALRLEESKDTLLVGLRILGNVMERAGMDRSRTAEIVVAARKIKPVQTSRIELFETEVQHRKIARGHQLLTELERAMLFPEARARIQPWFKDSYYPGLLKRVASGQQMTTRDESILVAQLEKMSGVRW